MKTLILSLALLFAAIAGCQRTPQPVARVELAHPPYVAGAGALAIRCGSLIDGVTDQPRRDVTVIVRAGRIEELLAGDSDTDLPVLDLREYTCLPGLIDMHDHITERPEDTADYTVYLRRTVAEQQALSREQALATLLAGFTTVRNVGVYTAWTDRELRDAINRGEVAGPRLQISGYYLTIPGGGGDLIIPGVAPADIPARFHAGVARGVEQFRRKAQEAIDGGADVLKVIASGAVLAYGGVPGAPEMTPEEIGAVVRTAHAAGIKVAAHAHGARSIKEAIPRAWIPSSTRR
jgi:imidazolonepropionase-like amidohydrolase